MASTFKKYLLPCIPFICFIVGYALSSLFLGNQSYPTPNLIGATLHEAILQTTPLKVNIQLSAEKECPGVAHGTIVSQKPAPGRLIKPQQSIMIVICKQTTTPTAPDLSGLAKSKAEEICKNGRVALKTFSIQYPLPTGTCIGQTPQKDQEIPGKKMIAYFAKDASNSYIMPNLINQPLDKVLEFLHKHAAQVTVFFQNEKLTLPYHDDAMVTLQKPMPGSFVNLKNELIVQLEIDKE